MSQDKQRKKRGKLSRSSLQYVVRHIIWPRRKLVAVGVILIIVNRFSRLVLPGSTKYLMDDVIGKGDTELLEVLLLSVGAALCVQAVTSFVLTRLLSVEAQHVISILRVDVQRHVIHLPVRYFDNTKSGELVSRIMLDVEGVRNLIGTGLVQMFGGILTSLVVFSLLLNLSPLLTLCVVLPLGLFGLISLKAFGYVRPIFRERAKVNADVTGRLTESLGGIRVIKGFNAERSEVKVFKKGVERIFDNVRKTLTATSLVASAGTLLIGLPAVGIMWMGGSMVVEGEMTEGDLMAFIAYLAFLVAPLLEMGNIGSQFTEAFAGLDRTKELMSVPRENENPLRTYRLEDVRGHLIFKQVHFSYQEGAKVLSDISFEAPPGSVTALVGSSGSGKTTIAGLAASFLTPDEGTVEVDGVDLSRVTLDSYRSRLGVVLQDDFLYEGTIRENILFGQPNASEADLLSAVKAAHVKEFADRLEKGLDTLIGERGVKLSGGQRQRVAIARALLADPGILILDEATSNLDTESEIFIQESLNELIRGRTTLVIAHRLSTIRKADQILVVENGKIVERGTHDQLIARQGRYHRLYTYQARI